MKKYLGWLIMLLCLSACSPSTEQVQHALSLTQTAAPTSTLAITATSTKIPTKTPVPCTDKGWDDIVSYYKLFNQEVAEAKSGDSVAALLEELSNTKDKVNDVTVDICTEHARQEVITGMSNMLYGYQLVFTHGDKDQINTVMTQGIQMIKDAQTELNNLGLQINFSTK